MAIKRIGTGAVRAQFFFVRAEPHSLTEGKTHRLFHFILNIVEPQIQEKTITTYVAFVEKSVRIAPFAPFTEFSVEGNTNWLSILDVESVLREKMKHASPEYRVQGKLSTHPPKFLTQETLVIVVGSQKFLLRNLQLYLEQEGVLRDQTFELLIELTDLKTFRGRREENFLHVFVQDKTWYRGNVEALGQLAARFSDELPNIMTTNEMLHRLKSASKTE